MIKKYMYQTLRYAVVLFLAVMASSCKKSGNNNSSGSTTPVTATPTKLGLYGADSSIYKILIIPITKIGTTTLDYDLVFDTGSGGMVIDAQGILPASMIGTTGFNFTGDSTVVNGITITKQTSTIQYGDNTATTTTVYGNLAYAPVTVGDQNGNIVITRLPFFLYYKATDASGKKLAAHDFDTFGVNTEYDVTFPNNAYITSPFSYYTFGTGLTKGFKLASLTANNFSLNGTYIPGAITLGLTTSDLASTSGYTFNQMYFYAGEGYLPVFPATVTYNNKTVSTSVLFDTGTEPYSYLEDKTLSGGPILLPTNTAVSVSLNNGYNYAYTVSQFDNLTYVENPTTSGGSFSILGLEFFLTNSYLIDFTDNKLGVKNN